MKLYTIQDDAGSQLQSGMTHDGSHVVLTLITFDDDDIPSTKKYFFGHMEDLEGLIADLQQLKEAHFSLNRD